MVISPHRTGVRKLSICYKLRIVPRTWTALHVLGNIILPTLQMSKLRVGGIPRSHCKLKQRWNENPGLLTHDHCPDTPLPPTLCSSSPLYLGPLLPNACVLAPAGSLPDPLFSVCGEADPCFFLLRKEVGGVKQTLMTSSDLCPRPHMPRCPPVTWPPTLPGPAAMSL